MLRVAVIAGSVVADALRRRVLYVVVFFGLVMALAVPYIPAFGVGVVQAVYREIAMGIMFSGALVITLSLAVTRIPSDLAHRTSYAVLVRPVSRLSYVIGVWAGQLVTIGGVVAAFALIVQVVGFLSFGEWYWSLWQGALAIWLEMGVLAALATAFAVRTGPVTAVLGSLTFLFAGSARGTLLPEGGVLATLYPSLDAFNIINPVAHGGGVGLVTMAAMLAVFIGYSTTLLVLAGLLFRSRDL